MTLFRVRPVSLERIYDCDHYNRNHRVFFFFKAQHIQRVRCSPLLNEGIWVIFLAYRVAKCGRFNSFVLKRQFILLIWISIFYALDLWFDLIHRASSFYWYHVDIGTLPDCWCCCCCSYCSCHRHSFSSLLMPSFSRLRLLCTAFLSCYLQCFRNPTPSLLEVGFCWKCNRVSSAPLPGADMTV